MRLRYRLDGERLVVRIEDSVDDEPRVWRLLATMGAPTQSQQVGSSLVWERWMPAAQLGRLERAAKLMRWELAPEAGEAVVATRTGTRQAYEAARPFDPAAVLAAARSDPAQGEALLQDAQGRLVAWARVHPEFAGEARADVAAVDAALGQARARLRERAAHEQAQESRELALQLRGVSGGDAYAAHAALRKLQEIAKRFEAAAPAPAQVPSTIQHFRGKLRPYQVEGVRFLLGRGLNAILADEMGLGKAQPLDARVLTPNGWTTMGDISVGDHVIGSDGLPHRVQGVFPQGRQPVYRVHFSDGSSTRCTEEHLWEVNTPLRKSRGRPPKVLSLRELSGALRDAAGNARHFVPLVKPVDFPRAELPVDPYLLGVLIGDGSLTAGRTHFSTADEAVLEAVRLAVPGDLAVKRLGLYDYGIQSAGRGTANLLTRALRDLQLGGRKAESKHIPPVYLRADREQRLALLQGLLDTDGYASTSGLVQFSTTSAALAEGVVELVRSLGGTARRTSKIPSYRHRGEHRKGRRAFTLTLALPEGCIPFRLERKRARYRGRPKYPPSRAIVDIEPAGEEDARCIAIDSPDGLYVTDDYILTHNTIMAIAAIEAADARAFVVGPANVLYNWRDEIERFTDEPAAVWHEGRLQGPRTARFLVTTYDALQRIGPVEDEILARPVLVLDEAHYIRNPDTLRAQLVRALPQRQRILLTGTPMVNTIEDYYELLRQVEPDKWGGSRALFRDTWLVDPGLFAKYSQVRVATASLLQRAASGVLLRRRKDDVLADLPPRTISVRPHNLPAQDLAAYKALEARAEETVRRSPSNEVAIFAAIHALRQALAQARVPVVEERVRELRDAGEAVVVYAHYLEPLRALQRAFGREAAMLEGATPPAERQRIAQTLGREGGPQLLVAQMEAGGIGLNFTGARHVVFLHFGWTPAAHLQAMDRVHRIGQSKPVFVDFFVSPQTIDERMVRILLRKEADQNLVLADESDVLNRGAVIGLLAEDASRRVREEQAVALAGDAPGKPPAGNA